MASSASRGLFGWKEKADRLGAHRAHQVEGHVCLGGAAKAQYLKKPGRGASAKGDVPILNQSQRRVSCQSQRNVSFMPTTDKTHAVKKKVASARVSEEHVA